MINKAILIAIIFDSIIIISLMVGVLYLTDQRTEKLMISMEQYEQYIQDEYGMSVYQYRELMSK